MEPWLDSEPKIVAKGSEKLEIGRSRSIFGTQPIDYAIMSYVIGDMERHLYEIKGVECGLSGAAETAGILRRHA